MTTLLAATKIPLPTLLLIGAIGAMIIIAWSYSNWRAAVKVAFVAALLEGAIRKWLLPQGQELVYFLKDVFLIGAYIRFYFTPDADIRAFRLNIPSTFILMLCAIVSLSALNPNINSALLSLYGLKIYFMYIPLIFMMPYLFKSQEQLLRQLTWYTLLAIPICALGFLQWKSGVFSMLNTYAQGELDTGATGFGVGDRVRVTGTFSYITGHTTFVIIFGLLHLVLLTLAETRLKWVLLFVSLPMLGANAFMGGSRASVVTLLFIAAGLVLAALSGRIGSNKSFILTMVVGGLLMGGVATYVFRDAWQHWSVRFEASGSTGDIRTRTTGFAEYALSTALKEGGVLGYGIGSSHPACDALRRNLGIPRARLKTPTYDNELGQVMIELGLLGFTAWYILRAMVMLACWTAYWKSPPGIVRVICLVTFLVNIPFVFLSVVLNHTAFILLAGLIGLSLIPFLESAIKLRRGQGALPNKGNFVDPRIS